MSETQLNPTNPLTLDALESVEMTAPGDLPGRIAAARESGRSWAAQSLNDRARKLEALGRLIVERRLEGATIISGELGRPEACHVQNRGQE